MTKAAFRATYSDWRLIKTRKVVQIVFEVPVEQAGLAYEVLDGMPRFESEVWCAIARLDLEKEVMNSAGPISEPADKSPRPQAPDKAPNAGGAHTKKSWHEMSPAQQAGILCGETPFRNFVSMERMRLLDPLPETEVARWVRDHCGVSSRSELAINTRAAITWKNLVSDYRAWMREPEVVV